MNRQRAAWRHALICAGFLLLFLLGSRGLVRGPEKIHSRQASPPAMPAVLAEAAPDTPLPQTPQTQAQRVRVGLITHAGSVVPKLTSDHNGRPMTTATWAEAAYSIPPPREAFG